MSTKTWDEILDASGDVAAALGLSHVKVATELARLAIRGGCAVVGCPDDVQLELQPADIPTGEAQLAARDEILGPER